MKISVRVIQNLNVFSATVRKKLFIVPVIKVFYFSKSFFVGGSLRIIGVPASYRIQSQKKAKIFGKKEAIEQMQKIQMELSILGFRIHRFNLLINTIGISYHVNKFGNKSQINKELKKHLTQK
jgi:hypothetical protein